MNAFVTSLRNNIKKFIPPILLERIRSLKNPGYRTYDTYAEAAQKCNLGYEQKEIVEVVI
jgi:hypothetical protein